MPIVSDASEETGERSSLYNTEWLEKATGKVVYVPSRQLSELPNNFSYKVIYIDQPIEQILPSRTARLKKKIPDNSIPLTVLNTIEKEKFIIDLWIESQPNQQVLILNWDELMESSDVQTNILSEYLNFNLNSNAVKKQIELLK